MEALPARRYALAALCLLGACATRSQPYRFASPLLGAADVPDMSLPRPVAGRPDSGRSAVREPDVTAAPIRVASAAAADRVRTQPSARAVVWSRLPAPHRAAEAMRHARGAPEAVARAPWGALHAVAELRALVGQRDSRDPLSAVLGWEHELGTSIDAASGDAGRAPGAAAYAHAARTIV
ncbi:MAG: hypothetical protein ACM31C_19415, partial [Acidobacteriota bacterium]